jgi:hypothetical protein
VSESTSERILGVVVSNNLKWTDQYRSIVNNDGQLTCFTSHVDRLSRNLYRGSLKYSVANKTTEHCKHIVNVKILL